uniref:Uncharacterized protein n=1 Tax=Caenorhabditis japonica TaxID=281687 RepID=A0A8R1E4R0_CAEJA
MISTGPAQVQHYALVLLAKRGAWLLLAAQNNAAAVSTISARHQQFLLKSNRQKKFDEEWRAESPQHATEHIEINLCEQTTTLLRNVL